jgi:pimeloyl-ACP methyl ester carboxylesterase
MKRSRNDDEGADRSGGGGAAWGASGPIEPPPKLLTMFESARAGFEATALMFSMGLLAATPRGDGHSVLVIPGFATDDRATLLLRSFLAMRGYDVRSWDLGWNLDHQTVGHKGEHILRRIHELREASGRSVSLVGWSLGGVIAREAARRTPGDVRQVVTLGSPFTGDPNANSIRGLYEMLSGRRVDSPAALQRLATGHHPLPVPSTAIFSKTDGIAAWENCKGLTDAITENVEVHSSHFGMVVNPAVFHIVADRLAQPDGDWSPFNRSGAFSLLYPSEA